MLKFDYTGSTQTLHKCPGKPSPVKAKVVLPAKWLQDQVLWYSEAKKIV